MPQRSKSPKPEPWPADAKARVLAAFLGNPVWAGATVLGGAGLYAKALGREFHPFRSAAERLERIAAAGKAAITVEGDKFDAPVFEAPQFEAPQFEAPVFEAPQFEAPQFEAPVFEAPQFEAPQFEAPVFEAPRFDAPTFLPPTFEAPTFEAPNFEAPTFGDPSPAPSNPEPSPDPVPQTGEGPFPDPYTAADPDHPIGFWWDGFKHVAGNPNFDYYLGREVAQLDPSPPRQPSRKERELLAGFPITPTPAGLAQAAWEGALANAQGVRPEDVVIPAADFGTHGGLVIAEGVARGILSAPVGMWKGEQRYRENLVRRIEDRFGPNVAALFEFGGIPKRAAELFQEARS